VRAVVLVCDAAQADPGGKVHMLGAGWNITSHPLPAQAIVAIVGVPWHQSNVRHDVRLQLEDADGRVVTPNGGAPVAMEQTFEVGRPPGVPEGTDLHVPIVLTLAPGLPIPPGGYMWRLFVDGETQEHWTAAFHVRASG
jgi:hypothetical protein